MRQILILSLLLLANHYFLFSQTEKGKFLVGITSTISNSGATQLGFQTEKRKGDGFENDAEKTFTINLSPKFGVFFWNNLALGIEGNLNFFSQKNNSFSGDDVTGTFFLVGPFARYYHGQNKVRPFAEIGLSLGKSRFEFDDPEPNGFDVTLNSNLFSYGGGVGIAALLGDKVSFDTILVYNSFIDKDSDDNTNNERIITSGIQVRIGFSLYLN